MAECKVFPGGFYPQNLVPDPQKLGARVLSEAIQIYIYLSKALYFDVLLV